MIDLIADMQHEIWSHWMKYVFELFGENQDGSVTISAEKVKRWKRQVGTRYRDLTRDEKYSDVEQAVKVTDALEDKYEIVSKEDYDELLERDKKLGALEAGGVENWQWYDDSMESMWGDE